MFIGEKKVCLTFLWPRNISAKLGEDIFGFMPQRYKKVFDMGKLKEEFCRGLRTVVLLHKHPNDGASGCRQSLRGQEICSRRCTSQNLFLFVA